MKKCLSLLIALSMLASVCVLPVSVSAATANIPEGATLIYAEDFEEGYASENLLAADKTSVTIKNGEKDVMSFNYKDTTKQSATVEAGPSDFNTSNVLKLSSTDRTNTLTTVFKLNGDSAISEDYDSKQIVVEYDVYIPSTSEALRGNTGFMTIAQGSGTPCLYHAYNGKGLFTQTGYYPRDAATYPHDRDWFVRTSTDFTTKKTMKYVVERNMTDFDSIRLYANNAIVKKQFNSQTEWNTTNGVKRTVKDFINEGSEGAYQIGTYEAGAESVVYPEIKNLTTSFRSNVEGNAAIVYLDNIKVYAIEPINFVGLASKTNVNPEAGIQVAFDQPFNATTSTFSVTDVEGNAVEGASITAVEMSADKKIATVKVSGLADSTEYKLLIDDEFTSAAGAIFHKDLDGVAADEEYVVLDSFTTYTAFKAVETPETISGLIPNDPRNVEIKTTGEVDSVSATYEGGAVKTSMLGTSAFVSFEDIAKPVDGTLAVTITAKDGQTINLSIPVTAVKDEINYIYNDGLESMELGKIEVDETAKNSQNGKFVLKTNAASLAVAGSAAIVEDAEQGHVLEMSTLSAGHFSVLYDAGQTYDTDGKVLVIQTKYKIPKSAPTNDGINYGAMNNYAAGTTDGRALSLRYTGSLAYISMGRWPNALNNTENGSTLTKDKWIEYTTVVDKSTEATGNDPHTFRFYNDGKLFSNPVKGYATAYPDATVIPNVYDWAPASYLGLWDHSAVAPAIGGTSYGVVAMADFRGTYTEIPVAKNLDKQADYQHSIYIDDFKAFFADKFAITSISENKDAFIPTRHTLKVVFNQKVSADQLSEVKLINAATNEVVEGWTAVEANGGYALDFTLPNTLPSGNTYKLVFTPKFHDIKSYQGLSTNNHDYVTEDTITIADYTAFTATGYQANFVNFEQGRTAKTDITLSVATKLTNADAKTAFKVVNDEGVEVAEGWTATVAADQKTITLDFTNLATDNYTVTSTDALVNKDGDKLDGDAVEIKIAAKEGKIMIFEEDFDGTGENAYALEENWFDEGKLPANGKFSIGGFTNSNGTTAEVVDGASVTVTKTYPAAATSLSGNALKVSTPGTVENIVKVKANSQLGAIDIDAEEYKNKVIVYEGDMYLVYTDNGNAQNVSRLFAPSFADNMTMATFHKFDGGKIKFEGTWLSTPSKTQQADALRHRWTKGISIAKNSNKKIQMVIDQRAGLDTAKMIVGGTQLTEVNHTLLVDHPNFNKTFYEFPMESNSTWDNAFGDKDMGSFYGFFLLAKAKKGAGTAEVYYDNLKAYLVDAFEITGIEGATGVINPAKDTIKINFTNKLLSAENALENISVVDTATGDAISDVTVTLAEGGYQAVVDLPDEAVGINAKITVSPLIKDEYGISLASKWKWDDYDETVGEGWAVLNSSGTIVSLHATEAEAEAAKGTNTVQKYTWTMKDKTKGEVNNFTIDSPTLASGKTPPTFIASGYVRDDAEMNLEVVVKTTKSTSLSAEATAAAVDGKNVKTTLTLTNPEDKTLDVWYIVAAYGQYNEMIGCQAKALTVNEGAIIEEAIDFNAKSENIESIKVYIWDGYKTMVPYQPAEEIFK